MGEEHISRWSATPLPQGVVPQRSQFWAFPFIHAFDAELLNLTWQHVGRGLVLGGQSRPTPWGRDPSAPQFDELLNKHAVICVHFFFGGGSSFLFVRTPFVAELAI